MSDSESGNGGSPWSLPNGWLSWISHVLRIVEIIGEIFAEQKTLRKENKELARSLRDLTVEHARLEGRVDQIRETIPLLVKIEVRKAFDDRRNSNGDA